MLTRSYSSFVLAVLQSDFPLFINCVLLVLVSNDMTGIWPPSPRENACDDGPMHASTISFSARTSHGKRDLVSSDQVEPHPRIKAPADECEPSEAVIRLSRLRSFTHPGKKPTRCPTARHSARKIAFCRSLKNVIPTQLDRPNIEKKQPSYDPFH